MTPKEVTIHRMRTAEVEVSDTAEMSSGSGRAGRTAEGCGGLEQLPLMEIPASSRVGRKKVLGRIWRAECRLDQELGIVESKLERGGYRGSGVFVCNFMKGTFSKLTQKTGGTE